jgi:hypothetical protein
MNRDRSQLSRMKESLIRENENLMKIITSLEKEMEESVERSRKETEGLNKILHLAWPQIQSAIKRKSMQGYCTGSTMSDLQPQTSDLSTQTENYSTDSASLTSLYIEGLNEQLSHMQTEISDILNSAQLYSLQKDETVAEIQSLSSEYADILYQYQAAMSESAAKRLRFAQLERETNLIIKYKESDGGYLAEI